ncbi:winged helix-turn-helix domain-containing protein [Methanolobus sp. ZRKC3]|uniref:helix-turn-helix transcriptional regulator n=1 Tax=Methanolobus sp. ZRKC3 TaxID=3125786 RepID=UPI003243F327
MDQIVDKLETPRQGLLPQIKILSEQKLILKDNGTVRLTNIGRLMVSEIKNIVSTADIIEADYDYWVTRDLAAIPEHLFKRLGDMHPCQVIESELNEMFELRSDILEGIMKSESILVHSSFIHPAHPSIFTALTENGTKTSVVLTENVIQKLETEFRDVYESHLQSENSTIYATKEMKIPGIIVSDNLVLLWLFNDKGDFEPSHMVSRSESAINWGKELFEHYKNGAESVTGIMYSDR